MTTNQAIEKARKLGLSTWTTQKSVVGGELGENVELKCVGFADVELALGEGETWDEAFARAGRLIFSAQ